MVLVSYATAPPDDARLAGLTFATASADNRAKTRASWGTGEVLASLLVLACIIGAYLYFTG
jgi:SSS family solute:Na+ symporter